jgi:hypothetical protein
MTRLLLCGYATIALGTAGLTCAGAQQLPRADLTPGVAATTNIASLCVRGYSGSVRPRGIAWRRIKDAVYTRYGVPRGHRSEFDRQGKRRPAYAIDHLIPIELGGSPEDLRNLWPEPINESRRKDRVENALHSLVCSSAMPIATAQRAIARDWRSAVPANLRVRPVHRSNRSDAASPEGRRRFNRGLGIS